MACCGQKRAAMANATPMRRDALPVTTPARFTSVADAAPASKPAAPGALVSGQASVPGAIPLRYLARSPIVVHGPVSGRIYRFNAAEPVQLVGRADAQSLLATGHFRRDG